MKYKIFNQIIRSGPESGIGIKDTAIKHGMYNNMGHVVTILKIVAFNPSSEISATVIIVITEGVKKL